MGSTLQEVTRRPSLRSSEAAQSASSSGPNTLSRLNIGTVWGTSPVTAPPATLPVGEDGSTCSGCSLSYAAMPRTSWS